MLNSRSKKELHSFEIHFLLNFVVVYFLFAIYLSHFKVIFCLCMVYCILVSLIPNQIQLVEMPPSSVTVFWDSLFPLDSSGINFDVMVTNVTSGETIQYKDILRRE